VGPSFSGFNVRVFTKAYPTEVAVLVLPNSAHEDQRQFEPRSRLRRQTTSPLWFAARFAVPLAEKVGLVRLLMKYIRTRLACPVRFRPSEGRSYADLKLNPSNRGIICMRRLGEGCKRSARCGNLGYVPLIVLTAGTPMTIGNPAADLDLQPFHEIWVRQLQPKLAALSTRG